MGAAATTRMVIPSNLDEISRVQEAVLRPVRQADYDRDAIFAIRLALDEAVSNAIRHGNHNDPSKHVTIEYSVTDKQVKICVRDEGEGFLPDSLPDPTTRKNLTRPHGRGVMLIRSYMTKVTFSDCGRCLTMIKTRSCRKPKG